MNRFIAVASVTLLAASMLQISPGLAAPSSEGPSQHILKTANGYVHLAETVNADGSVTATFGKGSARVIVSGAPGLTIAIDSEGGAAVGPAPMDKLKPNAARDAIDQYAAAGRSVVNDAIAVGVAPARAAATYGDGSQTTHALVAAGPITDIAPAPAAYVTGDLIQSWCVSVSSPSGKTVTQACDSQYMDQDNGGGDWYVVDKHQASGNSTDTSFFGPERLHAIYAKVYYTPGNQTQRWDPASTRTLGSCVTLSFGIAGQSGASFGISTTVCSDRQGMWVLDTGTSATVFGTTWSGTEPSDNFWEATAGVSGVHSPPSALNSPTLYVNQSL